MVWQSFAPQSEQTPPKPRRHRARRGQNGATWAAPPAVPSSLPAGFAPPPGLEAPMPIMAPPGLGPAPPPGLGAPTHLPTTNTPSDIKEREGPFEPKAFRKELVATLRELSALRNVARAVRRVRAQHVPEENQAAEFADLLTRAAEEPR